MKNLVSIILAAGKGTRMNSDLPKVLNKIGDKSLVEYCVNTSRELKVDRTIVVVGYKKEMVQDVLGDNVEYAVQEEQLGTGHAVMQAEDLLKDYEGYVLVANGDMPLITKDMFLELYNKCVEEEAIAGVMTIETEDLPSWGRIVRGEDGNVEKIVEAKDANLEEVEIKEKNTGVFCFKARNLFAALAQVKSENAQGEYYLTDVVEILIRRGKRVISVVTSDIENVAGVNTPEELEYAQEIIKKRNEED